MGRPPGPSRFPPLTTLQALLRQNMRDTINRAEIVSRVCALHTSWQLIRLPPAAQRDLARLLLDAAKAAPDRPVGVDMGVEDPDPPESGR